jgi:hypothetical protein
MGAFSYRITLLQRAQHHVELQGTITLSVRGKRKGKAETLSGKYLGPVGIDRVPLRFLYFQILEGELQIPEGFEPEQIRMMLDIVKGRPQKLDFVREWNPQGG